MPIYEYHCEKCGHAFDHLARTLTDKPAKCPQCGATKLAKQLTTFAATTAGHTHKNSCPAGPGGAPACATGTCPFA